MTQRETIERALLKTRDGVFTAYFSDQGLVRLEFPTRSGRDGLLDQTGPLSPGGAEWAALTKSALNCALDAKAAKNLPPLDLRSGTSFQQNVWQTLRRIPPGQTMTYAQVAKAMGRPNAARAVGQACGANPIPLLIPCHRVVAAHGAIGGFSCGLDLKKKLLEREGVQF